MSAHLQAATFRALARRRSARRKESGGAVIFIVAMTLAVLASLGMYALASATNEVKTAGYERQGAQSHYLSEYGILGAAENISPITAQIYLGMMLAQSSTAALNRNDSGCLSLPMTAAQYTAAATSSKACRRMGASEIANSSTPVWPGGGVPASSFGSAPLTGDFFIEMTDPVQSQPPQGFDLRLGLCFAQFTITSVGLISPTTVNFGNEGVEMARARIIAGPVHCQ